MALANRDKEKFMRSTPAVPVRATVLIVGGRVIVASTPSTDLLRSADVVFEGAATYRVTGQVRETLISAGYGAPDLVPEGP
jgi:hypothetical protein